MPNFPETRDSLIVQVKDPSNRIAWEEFSEVYRPVIYRIARTKGMQSADAQDLVQQVLISVANAIGRWEPHDNDVRFRNWLSRITRNAILKSLTRGPLDRAAGGSAAFDLLREEPTGDPQTEELIRLEYRRELYLRAAETVRHEVQFATWRAFELTVIEGCSVDDAATELNKSTGTVYASRSRIMRRLREAVRKLEESKS